MELKEKRKKDNTAYPVFEYIDEENYREYFVLGNRNESARLIPEQKQADYFLLVKGSLSQAEKADIMQGLKNIQMVLTAFEIDVNELKSKQNLIF